MPRLFSRRRKIHAEHPPLLDIFLGAQPPAGAAHLQPDRTRTTVPSIVLHPDTLQVRERIALLRTELQAAFNERITLSFEVIPRLRDRYHELFGDLEMQMQERTLEASERRRMVELFSLKLDRGQKLDAKTVELVMKAVRNEFGRIRTRMQQSFSDERRRQADDAWTPSPFINHTGSAEMNGGSAKRRAEEARDLYRHLAKRLHPDASREAGERERNYWDLVQKGYNRHDLPLLRTLKHLVETLEERQTDVLAELQQEEHRLDAAVRAERAQLESLMRDEIYRMRRGMGDDRWVADHRLELEHEIAGVQEEIAKCDRFLAPILSGQKSPPPNTVQSIWSSFVEDVYINSR